MALLTQKRESILLKILLFKLNKKFFSQEKIGLWDNDDRKEMEKSSSLYKMHRKYVRYIANE